VDGATAPSAFSTDRNVSGRRAPIRAFLSPNKRFFESKVHLFLLVQCITRTASSNTPRTQTASEEALPRTATQSGRTNHVWRWHADGLQSQLHALLALRVSYQPPHPVPIGASSARQTCDNFQAHNTLIRGVRVVDRGSARLQPTSTEGGRNIAIFVACITHHMQDW